MHQKRSKSVYTEQQRQAAANNNLKAAVKRSATDRQQQNRRIDRYWHVWARPLLEPPRPATETGEPREITATPRHSPSKATSQKLRTTTEARQARQRTKKKRDAALDALCHGAFEDSIEQQTSDKAGDNRRKPSQRGKQARPASIAASTQSYTAFSWPMGIDRAS